MRTPDPKPVVRLVPPHADKHASFQVMHCPQPAISAVVAAMHCEELRQARAFLQGQSRDWVMVEFWTEDPQAIERACQHLLQCTGLQGLRHGHFTREDIFQEALA